MCGIAGYISTSKVDDRAIRLQLALLEHRGPDSSGYLVKGRGVVGQTRLAIIDLVTGDPPISNESETAGVALNGEIYNFRELRDELIGKGHTFRTRGDTEVIVHLAEDLDPVDLARSLDGMFGFASWDSSKERLVLGRDRVGKKPLYYFAGDQSFVFASEIKALLTHPDVPRRLNERAIDAYLTFGYVPTPFTFFEGIQSVPPGHVLEVQPGGDPRLERYWHPSGEEIADPDELSDLPHAAARVRRLLTEAVSKRLVSDVPLGAFLSGGIDSSAVVAIMASIADKPVKTFTIGFEDRDGFDEREFARTISKRFGTDHTEFVVDPDAVDLVEQLVWNHDQPFGDSSAVPTYLLSKLTREHVTVALSGDGGDELFAGYERFAAALALKRYLGVPTLVRRGTERALDLIPARALKGRAGSAQRFAHRAHMGLPGAYLSWLAYVPEETRAGLRPGGSDWAIDDYRRIWDETAGRELLDRLLELNFRTYLPDDLLVKVDRMSMAHGLEVRCPILDPALVTYAMSLPQDLRIKRMTLKRVLKASVEDLLPSEILTRRKRGFGVPLARWFREDLFGFLDATVGSRSARVRAHLTPGSIDRLLAEHRSGAGDHSHALWALLTLEVFLRREGW